MSLAIVYDAKGKELARFDRPSARRAWLTARMWGHVVRFDRQGHSYEECRWERGQTVVVDGGAPKMWDGTGWVDEIPPDAPKAKQPKGG